MPLDTGIAVTKDLTLSLRESISNGCRNTNLLQRGHTGRTVAAAPRLTPYPAVRLPRPGRAGQGVRRRSVAAPRASAATANADHHGQVRPDRGVDAAEGAARPSADTEAIASTA